MRKIAILLSVFVYLLPALTNAQQQAPFADEIQAFEQADSAHPPKEYPIVFTGSSSIRMWKNLEESFPAYPVMNRGFGGSTLAQLDTYLDKLVFKYKPKQVVIYSGENDIATDSVDAQEVFRRFKSVYGKLRARLPKVPIEYISIKPSPSRRAFFPIVIEANSLIRQFLANEKNTHFIDVFSKMLDNNREPLPDIYLEDNLHMNSKGYEIWKGLIEPYLKK